jgi:hypothetical protein
MKWKDIKGFKRYYQVSNTGLVRSLDRRIKDRKGSIKIIKGKLLKPGKEHNKYFKVSLSRNCKSKNYPIHRMVGEAFCIHPEGKNYINHKDGNKENNIFTNLEWVTMGENALHAFKTGLRSLAGESHSQAKLKEREVKFIRYLKKIYPQITGKSIALFFGMTDVAIFDIWNFKNWKKYR